MVHISESDMDVLNHLDTIAFTYKFALPLDKIIAEYHLKPASTEMSHIKRDSLTYCLQLHSYPT